MERETLTATTPDDLVGALPVLLGFTPRESIVVCGTTDGKRLEVGARLDIGDASQLPVVWDAFRRGGFDRVLIVALSDDEWLRQTELAAAEVGCPFDVLFAHHAPNPLAPSAEAMDMAARGGMAVRDSREALAASWEPTVSERQPLDIDDLSVRDAGMVAALKSDTLAPVLDEWRRMAIESRNPNAYAVAAIIALGLGDGAQAGMATDQALAIEPTHSLSRLAQHVRSLGIAPRELVAVLTGGE